MAETTTRLTTAPSPSGGSSSAARPSVTSNDPTPSPPPNQITQPENSGPASGAMQRDYRISFWRDVFPRIASTCGILGLLLATILGVSQWLAQNQSIAISKESELITLALSCSDEDTKNTSVCRQFFDKYPDGPTISRRGIFSIGGQQYHIQAEAWSTGVALKYLTVNWVTATRFFQERNRLFQSALNISSSPLIPTLMGGILGKMEAAASQSMTALIPAWARLQVGDCSDIPAIPYNFSQLLTPMAAGLLIAWVAVFVTSEFGLFLFIGLYACMVDPMICRIILGVDRLVKLLLNSSARIRSYVRRTS